MLILDDFEALKRKLESLERRSAEATGELKAILAELRKLGYNSLKEAVTALPKLEDEARRLAVEYTTAKAKLESDFKDQLEEL